MANFFIDKTDISGSTAIIRGEEHRHIKTVLRMKEGEALTLCDGEGSFYDGIIKSVQSDFSEAEIGEGYSAPTEPRTKITLYQAIPKNPKLELIIQKATELGVVRIVPMNTARIVARLEKENKLERLRKIAFEAAKQSRRGIVPEVSAPLSFEAAVCEAAEAELAIIPYEDEHTVSIKQCLRGKSITTLAILIGPEGGFEEDEIALAREHSIEAATLGRRILRTETAGLVASAISLYELGDME